MTACRWCGSPFEPKEEGDEWCSEECHDAEMDTPVVPYKSPEWWRKRREWQEDNLNP